MPSMIVLASIALAAILIEVDSVDRARIDTRLAHMREAI